MKQIIIIILTILVFLGLSFIQAEDAYFAFRTHGSKHDFIFKLSEVEKIEHTRKLLKDNRNEQPIHVMGRIKKTQKDYNPYYSFHLDPDTITFFDMSIGVCDSTLQYVEEHLDQVGGAFLPGYYRLFIIQRKTDHENPLTSIPTMLCGFSPGDIPRDKFSLVVEFLLTKDL
ncbi:hypothetical protein DFA_08854 [Cavenderia fasciculata]|uniref:BP74 N-terminal domain-containing protein n=1 Tax=Cavenderia fasciculata TaxID=261658 RepID=F4Q4Q7_CACFS|nr:uncharacterized protein DFA_08854 [Cavenderia fasciculata]EGG17853.1 hypothetical protein DFA_08854 [Cavenderia fasciculata]|eukprot:XP_004356337.1 hypothetical protein DFA_08854 [Cavenderia fasciculata]